MYPPPVQACFDANTGRHSSCITLSRASEDTEGKWRAVGLLMTKTHIIATGNDGSVDWLALPTHPGGDLEVGSSSRVCAFLGTVFCTYISFALAREISVFGFVSSTSHINAKIAPLHMQQGPIRSSLTLILSNTCVRLSLMTASSPFLPTKRTPLETPFSNNTI